MSEIDFIGTRGRSAKRENPTMTLTEFLTARLDEDEQTIRMTTNNGKLNAVGGVIAEQVGDVYSARRMLADVESKRRIVDEHQATRRNPAYDYVSDPPCITCGQVRPRRYPCVTLRSLAAPYADHLDYRAEWHDA